MWSILLFALFLSDCKGWDTDSTFSYSEDEGFKYCHTIVVQVIPKANAERYPQFKLHHRKIPVVQLLWNNASIQPALHKLITNFRQRKETCQVIYILDPSEGDEYCRIQKRFEWLVNCDLNDLRTICYGRYTYYVTVTSGKSRLELGLDSPLHFCDHGIFQTERPIHLLPQYEYIFMNSSVEFITKLHSPCQGAMMKTTLKINSDNIDVSRHFLDLELKHLVHRACPIFWGFIYNTDKHIYGMLHTGPGASSISQWRTNSYAEKTLLNVIKLLNQTSSFKKNFTSKFSQKKPVYPGVVLIRPRTAVVRSAPLVRDMRQYTYVYIQSRFSFNFITCSGAKTYVTFTAFLLPFQFDFWIVAIPSFLVVAVFLFLTFHIWKVRDDPILFLLSILLEQGWGMSSKLKKKSRTEIFSPSTPAL